MPKLHIYKNEKETCIQIAEWMAEIVASTLEKQDRFTIALSGEDIPALFYKVLVLDYKDKIDWNRIYIFWGDDCCASFSDDKANIKSTIKNSIESLPISKKQIYTIRTDTNPADSAKEYQNLLHKYFGANDTTFDLVVLGLGEDGNTLSLFPGNIENNEKEAWVIPVYNKEEDVFRITLTSPVINKAAVKAFLVTGKKKQDAVEQVLKGKYDPEKFPAQLIQTVNKNVHWFLDEAAAGKLIKPSL